jgi:acyl-CoA synthetase (AMP-forming)/AMP-acid ligase II
MNPDRLTRLLDEHPSEAGDVIVHDAEGGTTRHDLEAFVDSLASALQAAGLAGRRVGVCMPNQAVAIATWFAVWRVGGTVAPLNPRVPDAELERLLEAARVSSVLTSSDNADRFSNWSRVDLVPQVAVYTHAGAHATDAEAETDVDVGEGADADAGDIALVQFTSGTTGRPKAVPLAHRRILALLDPVISTLRKSGRAAKPPMPNVIPVSLSLWAGIYNVLFAFRVGAPVVLMERFDPREFARIVRTFGIASSVLPPAALVMLLDDPEVTDLEPLRYVRSVSAPLSPYQARRFHDRFGIAVLNGYGQTELGGEVVGWSAADWREFGATKLGAVGRPHAGISVRVRDEHGGEVPLGELGEIEVSSSSGPPPATDELAGRITDDGWLRTGDLGRLDEDGFLWIEGRMSAMINRGGLKVFPDEVEEVLRSHPDVGDAAVVGAPDDRLGEVPIAFVVAREGCSVDVDALQAWTRERLAPYKLPTAVTLLDALPRNEMGKVLRGELVRGA